MWLLDGTNDMLVNLNDITKIYKYNEFYIHMVTYKATTTTVEQEFKFYFPSREIRDRMFDILVGKLKATPLDVQHLSEAKEVEVFPQPGMGDIQPKKGR